MAKQKIVVKVTMENDKKSRKAMKIAVSVCGVESVAFGGSNKEQITITGEGVDSVKLTHLLRKRVGYTELVSVGLVEEKKPEKPASQKIETPWRIEYGCPHHYNGDSVPIQVVHEVPYNPCSIL
ncbi:hypothetical protein CTI12_AA382360 [Artemisia annua]|uniref:Heavy metal-associated domain, HMA n=1 Tax=Artemisia annua TaxID=35608 RepID=A0A2U1MEF3_ARTAN|nr:hypothetical protein CTI12_AA382360 [Artemisia annua]